MTADEKLVAEKLATLIAATFYKAYWAHAQGVTETELLIDYDIEAAANLDLNKHVFKTCRNTIRAACSAFDDRVPYKAAHAYLMQRLQARVAELIRKQRPRKHHALDKN